MTKRVRSATEQVCSATKQVRFTTERVRSATEQVCSLMKQVRFATEQTRFPAQANHQLIVMNYAHCFT